VALNDFLSGLDSYRQARLVVVPREFHTISTHGLPPHITHSLQAKNYTFDAFQALGRGMIYPDLYFTPRSCNVLAAPVGRGSTMPKKTLFFVLALISLVGALVASVAATELKVTAKLGEFLTQLPA
jgi:hypothetical protein